MEEGGHLNTNLAMVSKEKGDGLYEPKPVNVHCMVSSRKAMRSGKVADGGYPSVFVSVSVCVRLGRPLLYSLRAA